MLVASLAAGVEAARRATDNRERTREAAEARRRLATLPRAEHCDAATLRSGARRERVSGLREVEREGRCRL